MRGDELPENDVGETELNKERSMRGFVTHLKMILVRLSSVKRGT
jgi:hypothetical protein